MLDIENKDLAVTNLAGAGCLFNGFDYLFQEVVTNGSFDLDLGQKINDVLSASVEFGMSFLPAEAFDFGNGDSLHADRCKRLTDLVKFEWLDDCGD